MKKIEKIVVTNSDFFINDFTINLSEKMNCIMGGRGTGKSTILYFIKSALEADAESKTNVYSILKNNLGNGQIEIFFQDGDNISYSIKKTFEEVPLLTNLSTNEQSQIKNVNALVDCDIYEASSIEAIGKNSQDKLNLIDKLSKIEIAKILKEIEIKQNELKENADKILSLDFKLNLINSKLQEYENVENEFENHKKTAPFDMKDDEKHEFESADIKEKIRMRENRLLLMIENFLRRYIGTIGEAKQEVGNFMQDELIFNDPINKDIIEGIISETKATFISLQVNQDNGIKVLEELQKSIEESKTNLVERHKADEKIFIELKQKFEKNRQFYTIYNKLSKRVEEKSQLAKDHKIQQKEILKYYDDRKKVLKEYDGLKKVIFNKRLENIKKLNLEFNGEIKITLTLSGITDAYEQSLKDAFKGSNMRYNILIPRLTKSFAPDKFVEVVLSKDFKALQEIAGIDNERSNDIFDALVDKKVLFEIETIYCPDLPDFFLKIDAKKDESDKGKDNYKKTEELSTGQRCTTVLPIIFAVSNNPLIIDQPEDNLDNKYIAETIHNIIRTEKEKRQLIFITHNPNVPVLADSDFNIFLNYNEKKSQTEQSGNINAVKNNIIKLLEGGEEAFKKRKEIYGV